MKCIGIIDCGTTNSRFSIVDARGQIIATVSAKIGVKDTAASGTREPLKKGLRDLFGKAVSASGITASDLKLIMSSGMITSEIGLMELPHQPAPIGLDELAEGLVLLPGSSELGMGVDIYLVRGIKNRPDPRRGAPLSDVKILDFMRGEETQMMGLISLYGGGVPTTVVNLSSHTKYIAIDGQDRILGSITTLSGQVYESLATDSVIAKSIVPGPEDEVIENPDLLRDNLEKASVFADEVVHDHGLLRSFLIPRFMDTLMWTDWRVRKRFLEACIVVDDLKVLDVFPEFGFEVGERVFLIGLEERCRLFETLFRKTPQGKDAEMTIISNEEEVRKLAVQGALSIASKAGLL
jgi:2-dehydro-3-deoxygalactonokinase